MRLDFEALAMDLAVSVAQRATQAGKVPPGKEAVGCVLMSPDHRRLSYGYTGTPSGFIEGLATLTDEASWDAYCVHAELNAILNAPERPVGWTLYCTKAPCLECCKAIVQAGISRVVAPFISPGSRFAESCDLGNKVLRMCGVSREGVNQWAS